MLVIRSSPLPVSIWALLSRAHERVKRSSPSGHPSDEIFHIIRRTIFDAKAAVPPTLSDAQWHTACAAFFMENHSRPHRHSLLRAYMQRPETPAPLGEAYVRIAVALDHGLLASAAAYCLAARMLEEARVFADGVWSPLPEPEQGCWQTSAQWSVAGEHYRRGLADDGDAAATAAIWREMCGGFSDEQLAQCPDTVGAELYVQRQWRPASIVPNTPDTILEPPFSLWTAESIRHDLIGFCAQIEKYCHYLSDRMAAAGVRTGATLLSNWRTTLSTMRRAAAHHDPAVQEYAAATGGKWQDIMVWIRAEGVPPYACAQHTHIWQLAGALIEGRDAALHAMMHAPAHEAVIALWQKMSSIAEFSIATLMTHHTPLADDDPLLEYAHWTVRSWRFAAHALSHRKRLRAFMEQERAKLQDIALRRLAQLPTPARLARAHERGMLMAANLNWKDLATAIERSVDDPGWRALLWPLTRIAMAGQRIAEWEAAHPTVTRKLHTARYRLLSAALTAWQQTAAWRRKTNRTASTDWQTLAQQLEALITTHAENSALDQPQPLVTHPSDIQAALRDYLEQRNRCTTYEEISFRHASGVRSESSLETQLLDELSEWQDNLDTWEATYGNTTEYARTGSALYVWGTHSLRIVAAKVKAGTVDPIIQANRQSLMRACRLALDYLQMRVDDPDQFDLHEDDYFGQFFANAIDWRRAFDGEPAPIHALRLRIAHATTRRIEWLVAQPRLTTDALQAVPIWKHFIHTHSSLDQVLRWQLLAAQRPATTALSRQRCTQWNGLAEEYAADLQWYFSHTDATGQLPAAHHPAWHTRHTRTERLFQSLHKNCWLVS